MYPSGSNHRTLYHLGRRAIPRLVKTFIVHVKPPLLIYAANIFNNSMKESHGANMDSELWKRPRERWNPVGTQVRKLQLKASGHPTQL